MLNVHKKSITEMIKANNKMTNGKLEKLSAEIRPTLCSVNYLVTKTKDFL